MRFTVRNALRVGDILAHAAATEIMPRFGMLTAGQVRKESSRFDVVTDADEAAEQAISAALEAAYAGAVIVGEEATARDGSLLDAIGSVDLTFVLGCHHRDELPAGAAAGHRQRQPLTAGDELVASMRRA